MVIRRSDLYNIFFGTVASWKMHLPVTETICAGSSPVRSATLIKLIVNLKRNLRGFENPTLERDARRDWANFIHSGVAGETDCLLNSNCLDRNQGYVPI